MVDLPHRDAGDEGAGEPGSSSGICNASAEDQVADGAEIVAERRVRIDGWPHFWRPSGFAVRLSRNHDDSVDLRAICPVCNSSRTGTFRSRVEPGEEVHRPTVHNSQGRPIGRVFNFVLSGERLGAGHTKQQHADAAAGLAERSHARQVGERAMMHVPSWLPPCPGEWWPPTRLERPVHPALDNEFGEPTLSRP